MATSANGQNVLMSARTTGPRPRLRKWILPGTNRHFLLREGPMGFLLMHVVLWFHERVEKLDIKGQPWDEWGWAVRPVRGQKTGYSNHAAGTAVDVNATLHPRGVKVTKTMSATKIRLIKVRMKFYRGVVVWGGGWRIPDGMHFEIGKVPYKDVKRIAKIMAKTPRGKRILAANPAAKKYIV